MVPRDWLVGEAHRQKPRPPAGTIWPAADPHASPNDPFRVIGSQPNQET